MHFIDSIYSKHHKVIDFESGINFQADYGGKKVLRKEPGKKNRGSKFKMLRPVCAHFTNIHRSVLREG
jgi:hypothetical protein